VALRLGMIVFKKTVCSSSMDGTRYTYSSRWTTKMRWRAERSRFGCSRMSSRSPRSMWTISSNPMPRSVLSFAFFASSQVEVLHRLQGKHDVRP
jgi:hypothetical protein